MAPRRAIDDWLQKLDQGPVALSQESCAAYKANLVELAARMVIDTGFAEEVIDRVRQILDRDLPGRRS